MSEQKQSLGPPPPYGYPSTQHQPGAPQPPDRTYDGNGGHGQGGFYTPQQQMHPQYPPQGSYNYPPQGGMGYPPPAQMQYTQGGPGAPGYGWQGNDPRYAQRYEDDRRHSSVGSSFSASFLLFLLLGEIGGQWFGPWDESDDGGVSVQADREFLLTRGD